MHLVASRMTLSVLMLTTLVACSKSRRLAPERMQESSPTSAAALPSIQTTTTAQQSSVIPVATTLPSSDPVDASIPEAEDETYFALPERGECRDCSYASQLKASRERAEELGAKRVKRLVVEPGRSSVEIYRIAKEGYEERILPS